MQRTSPAPRWSTRGAACATQVYTLLLRLCPRAFREEYGAEVTQVFRQLCRDAWAERGAWGALTCFALALGDLMRGALAEYLALVEGAWNRSGIMSRMRSSAILVFSAYIAFVVIGMGFQKSTEEVVKSNLPTTHPGIALAYKVVMVGAALALLATLVAGLPIAFAALRRAFAARRWGIVALFAVPPISLAVVLAYLWLVQNVWQPSHGATVTTQQSGVFGAALILIGLFILAAIASVVAVSVAIARSNLPPELYRFALAPEIGLMVGMLVTVAGIAAWGIQMLNYAPNYLAGSDGPIG
ncbi:MAG TPA: hypothetical protein VIC27_02950, partial [Ktedonobacterales bacterium]